ncbi:MAG TPA: hypothetical protein VIM89_07070 [Mucilaginibacter sp.]
MKIKIPFLALLSILLFNIPSFGQTDSTFLSRAQQSLTEHFKVQPVEKVYLHLDKPSYLPGDTIWFKAYTVIGEKHQLSVLSGVLYCELINTQDSVISRHTLKLISGISTGDFILTRNLKAGNYHIRAYTNWMRNAGTDYFYNREIHVDAVSITPSQLNATINNKPDVQFFPEGGELIKGIRSRVAVKCVGSNGLGQNIKGTISDNEGNEVAVFETQHLGMGVFALIPQQGKTYKATISLDDNSKLVVDLPPSKDDGFTLAVNNNDADSVYIKVAASPGLFQAKQNRPFYLIAQSAGKVYFMAENKLTAPVFTARVDKKRFPSGIAQFTLFSDAGEPLNERIIFCRSDDSLQIKVTTPELKYAPRQKTSIKMNARANTAQIVQGSFSVSVCNESLINPNENNESTILNSLLLTSDIKGYIEQPNYYFINTDDKKRSDLDVLMLTQGYRRFQWESVLKNNNNPIIYQPEQSLQISGALKTPSGKIVPNGKITLVATSQNLLTDTVTDANGNFKFTDLNLPDTAKLVLRARKENNGSNVSIYVKQTDYPEIAKSKKSHDAGETKLTPEMIQNIANYQRKLREDSIQNSRHLAGVTIKTSKEHAPDKFNNYGTAMERNLDLSKARNFTSIFEAIKFIAPHFRGNRVILNGLDLDANSDILNTFTIDNIQEIRLVDPFGFNLNTGKINESGTIVVTTKVYAGTDTVALKGVVIRAKKKSNELDLSHSANLKGGGNADQVLSGKVLDGCITLSQCLQGKVFGVNFAQDGTPINTRSGGAMSVIVDGAILSGDYLNNLDANNIYSIEVLRSVESRTIYGTSIAKGGALVITTKSTADPNYVTSVRPAGLITYPFTGFYKARSFYVPKYDHPKKDGEPLDLRTTVYWNPYIITDKDGNASFDYYNADTKGTYRVVIEGIDDEGKLGRQVFRYKVE